MKIHRREKSGKVEIYFRQDGRRIRKRFKSQSDALEFVETALKTDLANNSIGLDRLLADYLHFCRTNKSESTFRMDQSRLGHFYEWLGKNDITRAHQITPWLIERFKEDYLAANSSSRNPKVTCNRYIEIIKAMLAWAVKQGLVRNNPLKGMPGFRDTRRRFPRFFSKAELDIIFRASPKPYREYFIWLAYTGMRAGELDHLEWQDIDISTRIIKIQSKTGFHPKTYEIREIPLHPEIYKFCKSVNLKSRYIFDDGQGGRAFYQSTALKHLKNVLRLNNIPDGNLYSFRHTFASHLVMNRVDLATIKELMGHASITTTEQYLHVAPERKLSAVEKLDF